MKKRQIISILNDLNIDKDKYIITGETALTIYGIIKECDYIFLMCSESIDNEFIKVINKTCNFELVHNFKVESLESLFDKEKNKTLKRKIEDLIYWVNPRLKYYNVKKNRALRKGEEFKQKPPTSGIQVAKAMRTMEEKYGVTFLFCKKNECCDKILNLLERKEEY